MTFRLTHSPSALPGQCYFCGCASRQWFIDTEQSVEYHGAMYICNLCLEEMCLVADYITPAKYLELKLAKETSELQVYELTRQNQLLQEAVDALGRAGYRISSTGEPVVVGGAILSTVEESPTGTQRREEVLAGASEGSIEQTDGKGLDGVRSGESIREPEFTF